MHLKFLHCKSFKRFSDLQIEGLPDSAKLVIMVGPNGSGKSSIFDAFRYWQWQHGGIGINHQTDYFEKVSAPTFSHGELVSLDFWEPTPQRGSLGAKKAFYIRSAFRSDPDFTSTNIGRVNEVLDAPKVQRLIDVDQNVADNFARLVSITVSALFSAEADDETGKQIRDRIFGDVSASTARLFDGLVPTLLNPYSIGTFTFTKGDSQNFLYKNLSAGEKAAYNLVLDLILKRSTYDSTIYCIDEPDLHMHSRLQSALLDELVNLLPNSCQLWLATHSLGMINRARAISAADPGTVAFLDFSNRNLDMPVALNPISLNRQYWQSSLGPALDDLAALVAPAQIVLCEGSPLGAGPMSTAEFDARCLRVVFADTHLDTDFVSIGNVSDVATDRIGIGKSFQAILPSTAIIRLIDRDDRNEQEIADLQIKHIRVLSRRHIESYLFDDDVLRELCRVHNKPELSEALVSEKANILAEIARDQGRPLDDMKSAASMLYSKIRKILQLTQRGSDNRAFAISELAPLIKPGTIAYEELKRDIFGT